MSNLHAAAWRTLHRDSSVVENKIERRTLRRVLTSPTPTGARSACSWA